MLQFTVDETRCTRCRLCVKDCPARIITQQGETVPGILPEKEEACIRCQHCLAICPTSAVSIWGRRPEDSLPLETGSFPTLEQMTKLVRGRRSVRQYKQENVDPALIQQLLATLAHAPTGINQCGLTFTLIDDKDVMKRFQRRLMDTLSAAVEAGRITERNGYLQTILSWPARYAIQFLFRTAPHALIISAPPAARTPEQDIASTLAYFELLAHSAGLGTVWWGMLRTVLLVVPELKSALGLPDDHHYYAMLFGYPAVQYPRTVQRDEVAVIKRVAVES